MTKQPMLLGFPGGSEGKEPTCNEGDMSQEDALEKGEGNGYPLRQSGLENFMGR